MRTFKKETVLAMIIVVLLVIVLRQRIVISNIETESNDLKAKLRQCQIDLIVNSLRVPSEALYYDREAMWQIAAIRQSSYEKHDTEFFMPYANVVQDAFSFSRLRSPKPPDYYTTHFNKGINMPAHGTHAVTDIINHSFEHWWMSRPMNSLANLEHIFKTGEKWGDFQLERSEFDRYIKPLVLRLTESYEPMISLRACRVLLAADYRCDEVNEVLSTFLQEPKIEMQVHKRGENQLITDYRSEVKEAMGLNLEYDLGLDGPEDLREEIRQIHAEVQNRKAAE